MLLDDRKSIREIGFDQISSWDGAEPNEQERRDAVQEMQRLFAKFLDQLQVLRSGDIVAAKSVAGSGPGLPQKRDKKTEKLISDFRAKRTEANRLRRDLSEAAISQDTANRKFQDLEGLLGKATITLNLVTQNYNKLRANFEEQVQEAVRCELGQKLVPWLGSAEALAKAAQVTSLDLLQEAEELLQRQANIDQRYGLRSQLEAEALQCNEARLRLKDAIKESIQPLPEISNVDRKLEKRISEIQKTLQQTASTATQAGQVPPLLIEKLQHATTLDEVASVRIGLIAMESIGLLAPTELTAAYALIGDKASRLYMQASLGKATKSQKASLKGVPLYALQRQVADGQSCTLLIDGNSPRKLAVTSGQPGKCIAVNDTAMGIVSVQLCFI